MSFQLAILIAIISANIVLGLFTFLRNPKKTTNQRFGAMAIIISAWAIASFFEDIASSNSLAILFLRMDFFLGLYIAVATFTLINSLLAPHTFAKWLRYGIIGIDVAMSLIVLATPLLKLGSAHLTPQGIDFSDNVWSYAYYVVVLMTVIAFTLSLILYQKYLKGIQRTQVRFVTLGLIAWAFVALISNILLPSILGPESSRVGIYASIIYIGLTAYAIVRHKLFDIRFVIARSAAYLLLLVTLGIGYTIIAFKIGSVFFHNATISASQQYFNVAVAIILAFTFQPLRRFFEKITDRIFYRDKYDPQNLINQIGRVLAAEIELPKLAQAVMQLLSTNLRVSHVDILVLQADTIYYEAGAYFTSHLPTLAHDLLRLGETTLVADELPEGDQKEILRRYNISVFTVLKTHDERVGYLLFSDKRNGDIYNNIDLRVINIVSDELAIAVQNAKSYTQIQHFNQTLQQRIAQATAQLREANTHLEQLDTVKDEFMSMAAHQLGTPLTVIDGYISMVSTGIYGPVADRQREPLVKALHRIRLLKRLVADFLNISRIEAGRFFLDVAPTDLNRVVPEEVDMLAERAREKETTIHYAPPPAPLPIISLDEQKVRQAIMNLIDNAIYYTPKGNVTVSLSTTEHEVVFKVVDDGIGVPKAAQAKLFSKFFRAGNAKKERPNGTGIGLFLVREMVEAQGGKIIFASMEGKGSTFGFSLPLSGVPASAAVISPAPSAPAPKVTAAATATTPTLTPNQPTPAAPLRKPVAVDKLQS